MGAGNGSLLRDRQEQPDTFRPQSDPAPLPSSLSTPATIQDSSDPQSLIRQAFAQRGIDPNVALRVAQAEGLNRYVGDQGSSFGPFQLHYGGIAPGGNRVAGLGDEFTRKTGLDARDPKTILQQISFVADQVARGGWGPFHGAANTGIGRWEGVGGQKSSSPTRDLPGPAGPARAVDDALTKLGENEVVNRNDLKDYLRTGGQNLDPQQLAWCAAFVSAALHHSGLPGAGAVATSYLNWGSPVEGAVKKGDIVVEARGLGPGQTGGHVAIATGKTDSRGFIETVGGNVGNKVAMDYVDPKQATLRRYSGGAEDRGAATSSVVAENQQQTPEKPVPTIEQMLAELDQDTQKGGQQGGPEGGDEAPPDEPRSRIALAPPTSPPQNIILGRTPGAVRKAWGLPGEQPAKKQDFLESFIEDA